MSIAFRVMSERWGVWASLTHGSAIGQDHVLTVIAREAFFYNLMPVSLEKMNKNERIGRIDFLNRVHLLTDIFFMECL